MTTKTNKIWGIGTFNGSVKMLVMGISFFWAIFYNSIGFTGGQIGIILASSTVVGLLTLIPSGFFNDRIRSKNLVSIALLMIATQYIGISQNHEFPVVLMFALIGGFGYNLYLTSADSIFYKTIGQTKERAKSIGIYQGINYLSLGLGMMASGYVLSTNIPFENLIFYFGLGFLVLAVVSRILPSTITTKFNLLNYKKDLFNSRILIFLIVIFMFAIHFGAEQTSYGLFLEKYLGLTGLQIGLYMGTAVFLMGIWSVIFARLLKKIQARSLLYTGLIASSLGHLLMVNSDPVYSFIFRVFHEAGDAAMFVFFAYGISTMFDTKRIGGNNSIFLLFITLGGTLGALIFGPMGEKYGYDVPFTVTGYVLFTALLIAIIFHKKIKV